jgi:hypothetical protein
MKRALRLAPLLLLLAAGCSGKGNTGRLEVDPALQAEVPWIYGYPAAVDPVTKAVVVPNAPAYPPIGANTPDPGSRVSFETAEQRTAACAALDGIELSQWHHDFEPVPAAGDGEAGRIGVAQFFSAYGDKTEGSWVTPGDASFYADLIAGRGKIAPFLDYGTVAAAPWGLAADAIQNGPSCDGTPSNWALHIRGGRFNYFGGGTEHPLGLDCTLGAQAEACDHFVDVVGDGRTKTGDGALDASSYDGIAFWARRGPDGASGLQVTLQDKYTSDRLARTDRSSGTPSPGVGYCRRVQPCRTTCVDGASCAPLQLPGLSDLEGMHRCVPDGADPTQGFPEPALQQMLFPPCGQSACVPPGYDPDFDFTDTQCKPYNFTGLEENNYCFGDTPPPAADERCGDGFASNISLSTDWQFFKLPFDRFQQVGFAKKAPASDVPQRTLASIAFLFSVGNTDFYVDNLSFYRNATGH